VIPRLVATDLDGTLLRSDGTIDQRTRHALGAVEAAGVPVVLCTARPPRWLRPLAEATGHRGVAVCANGGVISIIGVYGGFVDKFPMGPFMNRSLRMRTGQCHVHRYMAPLLQRIQAGQIDPSFVITHRMTLQDAPRGYQMFRDKQDDCEKIVLSP